MKLVKRIISGIHIIWQAGKVSFLDILELTKEILEDDGNIAQRKE